MGEAHYPGGSLGCFAVRAGSWTGTGSWAPLLVPYLGLSDSSKIRWIFRVSGDLQHGWKTHPKTQKKSGVFLDLVLTGTSKL